MKCWKYNVLVLFVLFICPGVLKINNSKFQVLKPLEDTSRTELEFLLVELLKVHIPLRLLKHCLQLQKLLEEGFNILVLFILPNANVPTFLFLTEREKLFIRYLKKDVHRCACHTIPPLSPLPILLDHVVGTRFVVNTPLRHSKAIKHLKSDSSIVPGIL